MSHQSFSLLPTWCTKQRGLLLKMHWSEESVNRTTIYPCQISCVRVSLLFLKYGCFPTNMSDVNTSQECVHLGHAWHNWWRKAGRGISSARVGLKKIFHFVNNILTAALWVFMAGHRLVALLHHSNPKNTEFPLSSPISVLQTWSRKEREGYEEVTTTSTESVHGQQIATRNDEKHTNMHVWIWI